MKLIIAVLMMCTFAMGAHINDAFIRFTSQHIVQDEGWQIWKSGFNKQYRDFNEEQVRHAIWKDNFRRINEHNAKSNGVLGGPSLRLGMNHFGDLTNTEFRETMNGYFHKKGGERYGSTFLTPHNVKLPEAVDWRREGYVTPVKNQGQCGSCWSFSTTGALEGQHFRKTGKLVSLSEQNLVDCSTSYGNHGCNGGLMDNAFKYIEQNGGLDTEDSYPYTGQEGECHYNKTNVGAKDTGFVDVEPGNEQALKEAVGTVGPVSVAIDASHFSFQFYKGGVYNEPQCSPDKLDHGVLVVGYGTQNEDGDYWIVKNSWGPQWGLQGYVRMSRNKDNQCGIASAASYPLV